MSPIETIPTLGRFAAIIDNGTVTEQRELSPDETDAEAFAALVGKPETVWVLNVEHKHGMETWAAATEEKAWEILRDYVNEWIRDVEDDLRTVAPHWFDDSGEIGVPEDPMEAAQVYFTLQADEFYAMTETELAR